MSCLTKWPAGHNLSLLICGALSGCRACFLDFGFSCIPDFWKRRGCGFLLGVTTGKEVMFIKCAGCAGLSMLSEKKLFSFACQALCLNSFQNAGFTFHEETVPGRTAFFFLSLVTGRLETIFFCRAGRSQPCSVPACTCDSGRRRRTNFATCETKTS